jgi:uncharacterized membrane protein YvbJ
LVKIMSSYCPKCGNKVDKDATFCPKCGSIIKIEQATGAGTRPARRGNEKNEKQEKDEKHEKDEKAEKHEKREHAFVGWLIGGLAVILVGVMYFVQRYIVYEEHRHMANAFFLIFIGAIIIVGAFYGAMLASRRHPKP